MKFLSVIYELIAYNLWRQWGIAGFKKYLANSGWMFGAQLTVFVTSFITITIVARYLGPENYGLLSYSQSFVALFSVFAALGIDQIIFRELIAQPENTRSLLGTAAILKLGAGSIAFIGSVCLSIFFHSDPIFIILIAITASSFFINPLGIIGMYFHANVQAKYSAHISIANSIILTVVKLLIVYFDQGVIYFAATLLLESILAVGYLLYVYVRNTGLSPFKWHFETRLAKVVIRDSWPLLLTGMSTQVYTHTDQVMIKHFLSVTEVGYYSVAVKLTTMIQAVPGIVVSALYPALLNARKHNMDMYRHRLRSLLKFASGIAVIFSVFIFLLSEPLVEIIFGSDFTESIIILQIYTWSTLGFVLFGFLQNYLIAENRGKLLLGITLTSATLNVLLNMILIPALGVSGAALATLITYSLIVIATILLVYTPGILKNYSKSKF